MTLTQTQIINNEYLIMSNKMTLTLTFDFQLYTRNL